MKRRFTIDIRRYAPSTGADGIMSDWFWATVNGSTDGCTGHRASYSYATACFRTIGEAKAEAKKFIDWKKTLT